MSDIVVKFFRGSCPVFKIGQTIRVQSDAVSHSMTCEHDNECTLTACPVKKAIQDSLN
jgi:hypothetical protein